MARPGRSIPKGASIGYSRLAGRLTFSLFDNGSPEQPKGGDQGRKPRAEGPEWLTGQRTHNQHRCKRCVQHDRSGLDKHGRLEHARRRKAAPRVTVGNICVTASSRHEEVSNHLPLVGRFIYVERSLSLTIPLMRHFADPIRMTLKREPQSSGHTYTVKGVFAC